VAERSERVRLALLWIPVILYMAGIFVASSLSNPPVPSDVPDYSLHETAYFGLTLLVIRALARGRWRNVTVGVLIAACVIAVAYGATDEVHQSFVPERHPEWRDLRSDAIGAGVAAAVVKLWDIIRRL
jgi:VanZ family protein